MKKYLWLLALCDTAQAGQVLLERVEYQNLITKEKTEFIQHYNPQQQRLEVLEISHMEQIRQRRTYKRQRKRNLFELSR